MNGPLLHSQSSELRKHVLFNAFFSRRVTALWHHALVSRKTTCDLALDQGAKGATPVPWADLSRQLECCLGSRWQLLFWELNLPRTWWPSLEKNIALLYWCIMACLFVMMLTTAWVIFLDKRLPSLVMNIKIKRSYALTLGLGCRGCLCCSSQALAWSAAWSRSDAIILNFGLPRAFPWQQTDVTDSRTWLQCTIMQRHDQIREGESWLMHISKANKGSAGYGWPSKVFHYKNSPLRGGSDRVFKTGTLRRWWASVYSG